MTRQTHPQGMCPNPARYRRVGDPTRTAFSLCGDCVQSYSAPPFSFEFVPAETPEWRMRGLEGKGGKVLDHGRAAA